MENKNHLKDIPSSFYSFHEEGLFKNCVECERNLLEDDCEYIIEKAIRNYPEFNTHDVVFDYAICMDCATKIHMELSKESLKAIKKYFTENISLDNFEMRMQEAAGDIDKLTSKCMIKNTHANKSSEYQVYAHCIGDKINLQNPPYMISGEVLNEIADLISEKTRDTLNGFFDRHFTPDPSLMEPMPGPRLVLI